MFRPYCIQRDEGFAKANASARAFTPIDLKTIYNFPQPVAGERLKVAVISFGGGLFGNVDSSGVLTGGDLVPYWQSLGLTSYPIVKIQLIGNARNAPDNTGSTAENSLDVEMVGAINPNTEIILLIAPNTDTGFTQIFQAARAIPGIFAISCSWGLPESAMPTSFANSLNAIFQACANAGINIFCAAGDNGAKDGTSVATMDFPGSSPFVTCCGGTRLLVESNNVYDSKTQETVWNNNANSATGGGKSNIFAKPAYQQTITLSNMRMGPDIALVADPNTGVIFRVNNSRVVYGGTSVSAPCAAGLCCLLRCNTFINPLLYASPNTCFHDITQGNNGGTWQATAGFDMCSGLGSINGTLLKNAIYANVLQVAPTTLTFTNATPQQLTLRTIGSQQRPRTVTWTSSNTKIATVDTNGLVTPVSNGTCTISCSASPTVVSVTVSGVAVLGTAISIIPTLHVGESLTLALASRTPANTTARTLVWASSQSRIATVDANTGVVRGVNVGTVTLIATLQDANHARASFVLQIIA